MFSLSGYCSSLLLVLISGILLPLNAQSGAWEILCDTVANNYGYSYKDVYQGGDILSVESRGAGNQFRCTRMNADMSTQRWSFEYRFDSLQVSESSASFLVTSLFVTQFFIDSKEQIWIQVRMDHSAIFNHVYIICIDPNGAIKSTCRLDMEGIRWDFHERITFQETTDGVFFYDASGGRRSAEDSILLAGFTINASSELQIESVLNIKNEDYRNAYLQVKPRKTNLLLYDFGWASTFHLAVIDQQKNTMNAWKFATPKSGFLYSVEWWSDSTLIMIFSDSQLSPITNDLNVIVCMMDLQGRVLWSKKLLNVGILKWGEYSHERRLQDTISQSVLIPVSSGGQPTSGFVKLDTRNGDVLDQFFWQNPDYLQLQSLVQIIGNQFHVQMVDGAVRNSSNVSTTHLVNSTEDAKSCFRVEHCNISGLPMAVVLESVDIPIFRLNKTYPHQPGKTLYYRISALQFSVSSNCEMIEALKDFEWRRDQEEYCPDDTIGIIIENIGHNTAVEWTINGLPVNPLLVARDTFFFAGNFSNNDEIILQMRRLGCTWNQSITLPIIPEPIIDFTEDTSYCRGSSLTLTLPEITDYVVQWADGSGTLLAENAGDYAYSLFNEISGCRFFGSIDIKEDQFPENILAEVQNLCQEDLQKLLKVNLAQGIDSAYWLQFPELSYQQIVVQEEGTYDLVLSTGACRDTLRTEVKFVKCSICSFYIPSAFSPNKDGINDSWNVIYPCEDPLAGFHLRVYDRWGTKVFESKDIHTSWDGTFLNTDVSEGVFTYILEIQAEVNGHILSSGKEGTVTLLR